MTRVLVVDDREDNRYLLRVLLGSHGFVVEEASQGAEALAKARLDPPQLLISDLLMPVMDGFTLLREWKADEWLAAIPFVVYTASYTQRSDEALALDLGADAFILKPAEQDRFVALMRRLVGHPGVDGPAPARTPALGPQQALEGHNQALLRKLNEKTEWVEKELRERERALMALHASEARYKALVEHSMDMILLASPDGSIHAANAAACAAFGMSEAELRAAGRAGTVDPADLRLPSLLAECAASGRARGEINMRRADGSVFPVELTSAAYTDADGAQRVSLIMRDVSARQRAELEQRELERQLREAHKLQAVGVLAAGIAHDFNNVVGAILGFVALADAELPADTAARQHLEHVRASGERARSLVQRLLSFSGPQPLVLANLPLMPLIDETLRMFRASHPMRVELKVRRPDEALHARVDAVQLQQVLLNLCTNAWHAVQGGGGIEVGLAPLTFSAGHGPPELPPGRYLHLRVSDEGCGMDAATLERIFEPFFTTRALGQGSGLGLAATRSIVLGLGGVVKVDSEPGRGSHFHVYLPRVEADADVAVAPAKLRPLPGPAHTLSVLLVDDDPTLSRVAEDLLLRAGYRVSAFADPHQALAALRSQPQAFDLMFSDHEMPQLSGLELAQAAARLCPGLPVVLASGHVDERLRRAAAAAGVRELLHKERLAEDLLLLVPRALTPG